MRKTDPYPLVEEEHTETLFESNINSYDRHDLPFEVETNPLWSLSVALPNPAPFGRSELRPPVLRGCRMGTPLTVAEGSLVP